ncbi:MULTISPECIES: hypothetical protein [unclassified Sphingomonas]|uniref:hypothetical protein n=1 Tax=unclassified Sphingomonas TaxID=196159 RepID=UPI0006FA6718|nr:MULTISPECIES: hypothetical protein [unclassified Sphingomonas]KQM62658.1 hypothetical protein ASE65_17945 [Sphingomonas sp. Leaf16]KQN14909.1 hypothetical protein ASE81_17960 [Sphingomonas sp. Leaf29]KQN20441.1 hypothetical protein ASE83_17925 [Sphingomonas sp. Leaf32]
MSGLILVAGVVSSTVASAQTVQAEPPNSDILVQGQRARPSRWREAETQHVIVLSDGREQEVTQIAHNLERLYFLLSVLLNRTSQTDNTIKLRVTLIGDTAEFQAMDLRNLRWQQGPFNSAFDIRRYYDPRQDGAVLATTRIEQRVVLQRGVAVVDALQGVQIGGLNDPGSPPGTTGTGAVAGQAGLFGLQSSADLIRPVNEESVPLTAEGMIYAGFAQHYLTTFFPVAYPRWYLDGFGQLFSTLVVRGDTMMEYGRAPEGTTAVLHRFGNFRLADVLSGAYLTQSPDKTRWTPVHAWMLTHFLFFSPTRSGQFRSYLKAIASGTPAPDAAAVFGDPDALAKELRAYFFAKKPFERMTYPAERAEVPIVRRLSLGEAAFVKGRLELGSRIEVGGPQRDAWLQRLRGQAAKFPSDEGAQVLLAEAECRSDHAAECRAAADRALALSPTGSAALTWRGVGMTQAATSLTGDARTAMLRQARAMIAKANRIDTEAPAPLIAYYRSFADAGDTVPAIAVDGLTKALIAVPNAPATRLALGTELASRGVASVARGTLMPVAQGGYDSPERAKAQAVLEGLPGR